MELNKEQGLGATKIRHPRTDDYERVGELLKMVDPYIYPALLDGSCLGPAMRRLMCAAGSPFAADHVWITEKESDAVAVMVAYEARPCEVPVSSHDVYSRYLVPMLEEIGDDEAYVACLATDPAHQRHGHAERMLAGFLQRVDDRPVVLDVLKGNVAAMSLYEKLGFDAVGETTGYAYNCEAPQVIRMMRPRRARRKPAARPHKK